MRERLLNYRREKIPFEMPKPLLFVLLSSERLYVFRMLQDPVMPITRTIALAPPNTEPGGPS